MKRTHTRPIILSVLLGLSLFLSFLFIVSPDASSEKFSKGYPVIKNDTSRGGFSTGGPHPLGGAGESSAVASLEPVTDEAAEPAGLEVHNFRINRTDTFYGIMTKFGATGPEVHRIVKKASGLYDLEHVKRNSVLEITESGGVWRKVVYRLDHFDILVIERDPSAEEGFRVYLDELPHEIRETLVTGTIRNSLYEDGKRAGADSQVLMNLSEIFAWDVDFSRDLRKGDTFTVLYESLYVEGEHISSDRILGAEIVNSGKTFRAIYYEDQNGGVGYYDSDGRSLRRTLLKAPLRFRRITSYFTYRRYHPILKRYRPHYGIDYAAPRGTPISSAGSGRVVFAGWKRGHGRSVVVRHNATYSTAYSHMSRFGRGIRKGARVKQGETIGYVGSTGLSTGPHLHYEVRKHGRPVNPLKIRSKPSGSVPEAEFERFASVRAELVEKLSGGDTLLASRSSD